MDQCNAYIDKVQDFAHSFIKSNFDPQLLKPATRAQATYLLWLDVTGLAQKINAKQKAEEKMKATGKMVTPEQIVNDWFVHNAHVHMNAGSSYGLGGENHIRMNIGVSQKMLQQALTNMAAAVKKA